MSYVIKLWGVAFMVTMLTISAGLGPGEEDAFYTLLKPAQPEGVQGEDLQQFTVDTKNVVRGRSLQSNYTQVNPAFLYTRTFLVFFSF